MFLSIKTREKIEDIIRRISINEEVTLKERIFVENHAKDSSSIWTLLKRALSQRRHGPQNQESINGLIQSLVIDGLEPENQFNPKNDNIENWFKGAPEWLRRS
tara:strand:+ start:470 stop:778 length:309 start_codon:yes stop_codon:yes gene_type:complete